MSEIMDTSGQIPLTFNQRWNSTLAIVLAAAVLMVGLTLRANALNTTQTFEDLETGVRARVPAGWLLDMQSTEYVFRAQDPAARPFKTMLQVSVLPWDPMRRRTSFLITEPGARATLFDVPRNRAGRHNAARRSRQAHDLCVHAGRAQPVSSDTAYRRAGSGRGRAAARAGGDYHLPRGTQRL